MQIQTFRAKTMQQALDMVRSHFGPEASVLHTRELNGGLLARLFWGKEYEVAAAYDVRIPATLSSTPPQEEPLAFETDYRQKYRDDFRTQSSDISEVDDLASAEVIRESSDSGVRHLPAALIELYAELIEAEFDDRIAQEFVEHLRTSTTIDLNDIHAMHEEIVRLVESQIQVNGPLQPSAGQGRVVALVGPTGVGKTTTIAKLAANYRLRQNKTVGLITVDTYRIAAVEQLRTYAEIIDLPMEVVSTPREMREAIARMKSLDLVLMDTAGRSPRDEVRIQELKAMLAEANPAEVHLVLSAVGGAKSLATTAERFAAVGTTAMIVTKLDEATGLGNLFSVARGCRLPISYLTDGQNVPDDIQIAQQHALAQQILKLH